MTINSTHPKNVSEDRSHGTTQQTPTPSPAGQKLSLRFWGIDWNEYFPKKLNEQGITVQSIPLSEFNRFMELHFTDIYGTNHQEPIHRLLDEMDGKRLYYEIAGDCFAFYDGTKPIGVYMGTAFDWSTYYLRSVSILTDYQGQKIFQTFITYYLRCLEERGVQRIEADLSPTNLGEVHLLTKLGFMITGFNITDRWGAMARFTRFHPDKAASGPLDTFSWGIGQRAKKELRR